MRLFKLNFIAFGLLTGSAVALAVTLTITVMEWIANPGGIFRGPEGTNWKIVWDLARSWLVPTFAHAASVSAIGHLLVTALISVWKKCRRTDHDKDDSGLF